jgi:preprotein translocase subunit SecD
VLEVDTSELSDDALKGAQERALEVIRNRIDTMGLTEPIIYPESGNNASSFRFPASRPTTARARSRFCKARRSSNSAWCIPR